MTGGLALVALVAGMAAVPAVQAPPSNAKLGQKTIQSISIKVIGCVERGREAGHYRLTRAVPSGDDTLATALAPASVGSGQDVSFENSPSFDLIGTRLVSPHLGHKIEIVGITSDTRLNNGASFNATIGSSASERATLTVNAVRMIAATCP